LVDGGSRSEAMGVDIRRAVECNVGSIGAAS
jgi:hypothetical protein